MPRKITNEADLSPNSRSCCWSWHLVKTDLQAQDWSTVLKHDVPDVQTSVRLGCIEDGRTNWIPAAVSEIGHVVPTQYSTLHCRHVTNYTVSQKMCTPPTLACYSFNVYQQTLIMFRTLTIETLFSDASYHDYKACHKCWE